MASLLEQALESSFSNPPRFENPSKEEIELAVAWFHSEVSGPKLLKVLGFERTNGPEAYVKSSIIVKNAIAQGKVSLTIK